MLQTRSHRGQRALQFAVLDAARAHRYEVVVAAIKEETSPEMESSVTTNIRVGRTLLSDNAWESMQTDFFAMVPNREAKAKATSTPKSKASDRSVRPTRADLATISLLDPAP